MARSADPDGYNGPGKEEFLDACAQYEEHRFDVMRATSLAGKVLNAWEKRGGNKADIRDAFILRKLTPEEQQAELRRQARVAGWLGIISEEVSGQKSFLKAFDAPANTTVGGVPLGSRLSLARAKTAGFREGKAKKGPSLQEGIEQWGWEADSAEAEAYAEGWGQGFELRPVPPIEELDAEEAEENAEAPQNALGVRLLTDQAEPVTAPAGPKKRGRKPRAGRSAALEMAERAARMDDAPAEERPGWQPDRDFADESQDGPGAELLH